MFLNPLNPKLNQTYINLLKNMYNYLYNLLLIQKKQLLQHLDTSQISPNEYDLGVQILEKLENVIRQKEQNTVSYKVRNGITRLFKR